MGLNTTPATVLKTYDYSETSKILRLLTRDQGLCSVIAKGARRPKSRFGGVLEPFTDGIATYYAKEGRELHTLSGFELVCERQSLGEELVRFAGASLLTELALRFAAAGPDADLYFLLQSGLDRLVAEDGDLEAAVLEEAWRLIVHLGFTPSAVTCSRCGRSPDAGAAAYFDLRDGVLICGRCRDSSANLHVRVLKPEVRAELVALVSQGSQRSGLSTGRVQRDLLREFIAYHLAEDRPLNSLRFLDEHLG